MAIILAPHRRAYWWWILGVVIAFVLVTFSVFIMSSFQIDVIAEDKSYSFRTLLNLENEVVMMLPTINTAQFVSLLYVAAKWLFPTKSPKKGEVEV